MQTIELIIKDESKDGVFAISLVENPAIEEDFVYLSSHEIELKVVDEEQRIVVGYALIPDKEIYRKVKDTEFNIIFSKETVRLTSELYMKQLNLNNVTVDHTKKIQGASVIESWITEDEKHDKVNLYGLKPILGGWVVKMKIYNDEEWKSVKDGKYKGFSIEGKFDGFEALEQKKQDKMDLKEEIKSIIKNGLELESKNVELSTIDDLKKYLTTAESSFKEFDSTLSKFYELKKVLVLNGEKYIKETSQIENIYQKALSLSKELGLDFTKTNEYKRLNTLIINGDPKAIQNTLSRVKSI